MKKVMLAMAYIVAISASVSAQDKNVKVSDLGPRPKSDVEVKMSTPKPADPPSKTDAAVKAYQNMGSPKPIMQNGKPVGAQGTIHFQTK